MFRPIGPIKRVQAKDLVSEGMHLGRKQTIKYFHKLEWLIIKRIKKSNA